ncbi:DUF4917 family protein [Desulfovibrio desulfuricans]|uniref:DUF4917 family protein n=1 Tax=Desulfovibrio desulfuricans TaxID=876 RepID=UPI001C01750D|nr:DUF4917 family protein [Desulfovibrio desulfuricans]MBT9749845.1 DUF4917 family protein [Desulfovibrio desulfuricans]
MKKFAELIAESSDDSRNLLIGNGYSAAVNEYYNYKNLKENTDFSEIPWVKEIFNSYHTNNFELVLEMLGHAKTVNTCSGNRAEAQKDAEARAKLVDCFVDTLRVGHPDNLYEDIGRKCITKQQYTTNGEFLKKFSNLFSLNYDLLLYWSFLENKLHQSYRDNFSERPEGQSNLWFNEGYSGNKEIWYLHGALHLRTDFLGFAYKIIYNKEVNIREKLKNDIERSVYPILVFEGTDEEKMYKINSNRYLTIAYNMFSSLSGSLFTYGFSFGSNDMHIRNAILKSNITHLNIGVYGDVKDHQEIVQAGSEIMRQSEELFNAHKRSDPVEVTYYDTSSFAIW